MIGLLRQDYPRCSVRRLCQLLAVAPSSYYYRREDAEVRRTLTTGSCVT